MSTLAGPMGSTLSRVGTAEAILRHLAALAPKGRSADGRFDVVASSRDFAWLGDYPMVSDRNGEEPPPEWFDAGTLGRLRIEEARWIAHQEKLQAHSMGQLAEDPGVLRQFRPPAKMRSPALERLAAADAINPLDSLLRAGSMWVVGRRRIDGEVEPVLFPVLIRSVRLFETGGSERMQPRWMSGITIAPLLDEFVGDVDLAHVEEFGMGTASVTELCRRAGFPIEDVMPFDRSPLGMSAQIEQKIRYGDDVYFLAPGTALYTSRPASATTIAAGLAQWSSVPRVSDTAFGRIYGLGSSAHDESIDDEQVETSLPTNAKQRQAIARSRQSDITAVSGPPGTGKTHLVAAAAVDAIARGDSVLIATQTDHAAESICELLSRYPTPPFVRFGRAEHRQRVADHLAGGTSRAPNYVEFAAIEDREQTARQRRDDLRQTIRNVLVQEQHFSTGLIYRDSLGMVLASTPGLLEPELDLDTAERLLHRAQASGSWFTRRRARRAKRTLQRLVKSRPGTDLASIARSVEVAQASRSVDRLLGAGGASLDSLWAQFDEAEENYRSAFAAFADARRRRSGRRERRRARSSMAALATVLRTGAERRATMLGSLEGDDFLDLLPLWVGTLDEVERTLPVISALFDVVILDEASQIDQLRAAGVLCRAERAVVVGDPQQLRHVSFVADADIDRSLDAAGIVDSSLRGILDVRRNSIFDVAVGASEMTWLDEHYRSVPHLIDFSARRFYDDRLRLMTQHPRVEGEDAVEQVAVEGERVDGINQAEVERVKQLITEIAYRPGHGTIGVITPFRKQADALTEMMLDRFSLTQIRNLGLRAGTVHSFQGTERDTMIVSLALGTDDLGGSLRFVEDRNLFNVMITRARRHLVLVHSFEPADLPAGLLRDYFRSVDDPPELELPRGNDDGWTKAVARALDATAGRVVTGYPVAGWEIDIAYGSGDAAFGIECGVHPDGPDAHIERHLTLRRAGWDLVDAFESRWYGRAEEVAVQLSVDLRDRQRAYPGGERESSE